MSQGEYCNLVKQGVIIPDNLLPREEMDELERYLQITLESPRLTNRVGRLTIGEPRTWDWYGDDLVLYSPKENHRNCIRDAVGRYTHGRERIELNPFFVLECLDGSKNGENPLADFAYDNLLTRSERDELESYLQATLEATKRDDGTYAPCTVCRLTLMVPFPWDELELDLIMHPKRKRKGVGRCHYSYHDECNNGNEYLWLELTPSFVREYLEASKEGKNPLIDFVESHKFLI